jgi:hypothetical protein
LKCVGKFFSPYGRTRDSEVVLRAEWKIRMKLFGPEHRGTLMAMKNLSSIYHEQGKLTKAARLQEIVLEERKDNPEIGIS